MYVSKHQLLIIIDMLTYVKKQTYFDFDLSVSGSLFLCLVRLSY